MWFREHVGFDWLLFKIYFAWLVGISPKRRPRLSDSSCFYFAVFSMPPSPCCCPEQGGEQRFTDPTQFPDVFQRQASAFCVAAQPSFTCYVSSIGRTEVLLCLSTQQKNRRVTKLLSNKEGGWPSTLSQPGILASLDSKMPRLVHSPMKARSPTGNSSVPASAAGNLRA